MNLTRVAEEALRDDGFLDEVLLKKLIIDWATSKIPEKAPDSFCGDSVDAKNEGFNLCREKFKENLKGE